jgi:hypothetical protein
MAGDKCIETFQNDPLNILADWAIVRWVRVIQVRLRNWNHSGVSPLFWIKLCYFPRIKNLSQENRCSPWYVLEEDVRYTVPTRCLSTLQFLNQLPNLSGRRV